MNRMWNTAHNAVGLDEGMLAERRRALGLTAEDEAELTQYRGAAEAMAQAVADEFYRELQQTPEYRALVTSPDMGRRMHATMSVYLVTLFCGRYDLVYAADRLRLGQIHHRMGLSQSQLVAALMRLKTMVAERLKNTGLIEALPEAIHKVFLFDLLLIIDAYEQSFTIQSVRPNGKPAHPPPSEGRARER